MTEVYGAVALITGRSSVAFVGFEHMSDEELKAVAAFEKARPSRPTWRASHATLTSALVDDLEILKDGKLVKYDPSAEPEPVVYLLYYSAGWCGPCHRFTPELVQAYKRWREALGNKFELIFVTDDRDAKEQADYARDFQMPWPMLRYSRAFGNREAQRWAGSGIPCLVALTPEGSLIFHTYHGTEYMGADSVETAFDQLVPMLVDNSAQLKWARHRLAVLEYVEAAGQGSSRVQPYLMAFDPAKYGEMSIPPVNIRLSLNEWGDVTDAKFDSEVSPYVADMILADARKWQFLPAVKGGKACAATVTVPFQIGPTPASKPNAGT